MEAPSPKTTPPGGKKAACDPPEQDVSAIEPGPRDRALANEYILLELFSYLKPEDLMECRLVNKVWNEMATKASSLMVHFGRNQMGDLIEFMKTVDKSGFRWKKFAVDGAILLGCSPEQKSMLPKFFEKVAPVATHLKITISADFPHLFPTTRTRPDKNTEYPNLQSLEINLIEDRRRISNPFLIDILGHAPKLESLSIRKNETAGTLDDMFQTVPWHQIRHLELKGHMKHVNFQRIWDAGRATLQLKSFKLKLNEGSKILIRNNLNAGVLKDFLETQSDTLETLELEFKCGPLFLASLSLPNFLKLKNLALSEDAWAAVVGFMSVSSFRGNFPVLESFYLSGSKWVSFSVFLHGGAGFYDIIPVVTVKELKLDLDLGYDRINDNLARSLIQKVAEMFPNLTKLRLPAYQRLSKAIDMQNVWNDLEELTLFCDHKSSTDNALMKNPEDGLALSESDVPNRETFNFLHKIKVLEFDIAYKSRSRVGKSCCLSDVTCRSVLLKLPNLKQVNLAALKQNHVSKAVISEMREKFVVVCKRKSSNVV